MTCLPTRGQYAWRLCEADVLDFDDVRHRPSDWICHRESGISFNNGKLRGNNGARTTLSTTPRGSPELVGEPPSASGQAPWRLPQNDSGRSPTASGGSQADSAGRSPSVVVTVPYVTGSCWPRSRAKRPYRRRAGREPQSCPKTRWCPPWSNEARPHDPVPAFQIPGELSAAVGESHALTSRYLPPRAARPIWSVESRGGLCGDRPVQAAEIELTP
jgi:hypothetical protein